MKFYLQIELISASRRGCLGQGTHGLRANAQITTQPSDLLHVSDINSCTCFRADLNNLQMRPKNRILELTPTKKKKAF